MSLVEDVDPDVVERFSPPSRQPSSCGCVDVAVALEQSGASHVFAVAGAPVTDLGRRIDERQLAIGDGTATAPLGGCCFEWSFNEKVAAESAVGVSMAGGRSVVLMKQCGLNLAFDPLVNAVHHGIGAGIVVLVGDDTRATSSTVLQDTRHLASAAGMPVLELSWRSDPVRLLARAFDLSELASIPVVVRFHEDVHAGVEIGGVRSSFPVAVPIDVVSRDAAAMDAVPTSGDDVPGFDRHLAHGLTKFGRSQHHRVVRWPSVRRYVDRAAMTQERHSDACRAGVVIVGGAAVDVPAVGGSTCVIEVESSWPVPTAVEHFVRTHDRVMVLEESLPFVEPQLQMSMAGHDAAVLLGRSSGHLPPEGPLGPVVSLLSNDLTSSPTTWQDVEVKPAPQGPPPTLPYGTLFEALAKVATDGVFVSADVGSSVKLCYPPYEAASVALCLGSPIAVAAGHARRTGEPGVAVIGDYGLLHTGIEGMLEMVHRDIPGVVVVLANGVTAQTGGLVGASNPSIARPVSLPTLLHGCGVQHVRQWQVDDLDVEEQRAAIAELLRLGTVAVAIVHQGIGIVA